MISEAIYRHEYKYPINPCDCEILSRRLGAVMKRDPHAGSDGKYLIRSLYFDSFNDRALMEKINGANPRSKFRIRIYNGRYDYIVLEKKVKNGELTQKLSAAISKDEYEKIIAGDLDWMLNDGRGVIAELYAQMKGYSLRPKTLVEYTRTPFIYEAGNVRVTIDCDIRTGVKSIDLFDPTPLTPTEGLDVLEVKYDRFLPEIIRHLISSVSYSRQSVSKYEICRTYG